MTTRWLIRCLRHTPNGRCNFWLEWHTTQDAMIDAVAEHKRRNWDRIDWGEVAAPDATRAVAVGGWNMPQRQLELW